MTVWNRIFYEQQASVQGYRSIAGVDEAGRGALAGPVVAAACILPILSIERSFVSFAQIQDSKQLNFKKREALYHMLTTHSEIAYGVGIVSPIVIDEMNILNASLYAMTLAIANLSQTPDYVLIDGNALPHTSIPAQAIIKGDRDCISIGAASIIAKHTRDLLMIEYAQPFPHYGFAQNKGYGTKKHLDALNTYGPCGIHRRSFAPITCFGALNVSQTESVCM